MYTNIIVTIILLKKEFLDINIFANSSKRDFKNSSFCLLSKICLAMAKTVCEDIFQKLLIKETDGPQWAINEESCNCIKQSAALLRTRLSLCFIRLIMEIIIVAFSSTQLLLSVPPYIEKGNLLELIAINT